MKYDNALLLAALAIGILIGSGIHAFTHRNHHEIVILKREILKLKAGL